MNKMIELKMQMKRMEIGDKINDLDITKFISFRKKR